MKAPTVATYQHYVLFRQASRIAIGYARSARGLKKMGVPAAAEEYKRMSARWLAEARCYWQQVEFMEV